MKKWLFDLLKIFVMVVIICAFRKFTSSLSYAFREVKKTVVNLVFGDPKPEDNLRHQATTKSGSQAEQVDLDEMVCKSEQYQLEMLTYRNTHRNKKVKPILGEDNKQTPAKKNLSISLDCNVTYAFDRT